MLDMLAEPGLGGGIQHVEDCFKRYLGKPEHSDERLVAYADRLGNGAVFKRLGFLAERSGRAEQLQDSCRSRLTQGYAKIDPALKCQRLVTRWKLRVPDDWIAGTHDWKG